jgi:hypothetical protein
MVAASRSCYNMSSSGQSGLKTAILTYAPTHLHTYTPTHLHTYTPTHLLIHKLENIYTQRWALRSAVILSFMIFTLIIPSEESGQAPWGRVIHRLALVFRFFSSSSCFLLHCPTCTIADGFAQDITWLASLSFLLMLSIPSLYASFLPHLFSSTIPIYPLLKIKQL